MLSGLDNDQTMCGNHAFKTRFAKYLQPVALDKEQQSSRNVPQVK
jgi:hypothetical protein